MEFGQFWVTGGSRFSERISAKKCYLYTCRIYSTRLLFFRLLHGTIDDDDDDDGFIIIRIKKRSEDRCLIPGNNTAVQDTYS